MTINRLRPVARLAPGKVVAQRSGETGGTGRGLDGVGHGSALRMAAILDKPPPPPDTPGSANVLP